MDNFDCSINQRFFYSSLDPLYECSNIHVFQGFDTASNTKIFIKLIDDYSFQEPNRSQPQSSKQHWRQYNVQLYASLAATNSVREFSQKIIDIIALSEQRTAIIFSCSNTLGTLANSLKNAKSLDEPDALLVLKYVAQGIQEFHSKGLVHGSICLENIAITEGSFEVTSQALNGIEYQGSSEELSLESRQSLFYLAPEILEIYEDPSQILLPTVLSDSWSLGVLFFRLLRGKFLYAGDSSDDILDAIYAHNTQLPGWLDTIQEKEGDFPHQISKQSEQLLTQLLSRNPQERPSISDVLSSELLQLIRIPNKNDNLDQTNRNIFKNLPSSILAQYTFFTESKLKNDLNGYACEELYFGIGFDGPARLKIINLSTNNELNEQYMLSLQRFRSLSIKDTYGRNLLVSIKELAKSPGKLFLLVDYSSQGSLHEYLARRNNTNQRSVWEVKGALVMHRLLNTMIKIHPKISFLCGLFAKNTYVHQGMARIGEPMLLNEAVLSEKQSMMDIVAPECKQIVGSETEKYDYPKADIWNFGILLYKMIYGEDPIFDLQQKPIFPQQQYQGASESLKNIIISCLSYSTTIRPDWDMTTNIMQQYQNDQKYNLSLYQISNDDELHLIGSQDDAENIKLKRKEQNKIKRNNQNNRLQLNDQLNESESNNNKGKYFQKGQKRKSQLYGEYDAQSQKTASDSYTNGFGHFNRPTEDDGVHLHEEEFIVLPRTGADINLNQSNISEYQFRDFNDEEGIIADYEPPKAVTQKIQFNSKNKNNNYLSKVQMVKGSYMNSTKATPFENLNVKDSQIIASNVLQEYLPPEEITPLKTTLEIVPTQSFGGTAGRVVKIGIKIAVVLILFFALFFRSSVVNSWDAIGNQGNMKVITANVVTGAHSYVQQSQIISLSTGQFMKTSVNFSSMKMLNGCLDNLAFEDYTNEKTILDIFNSVFFFFYAFFCFLSFLSILAAKCYHIFKLDWNTVNFNARNGVLSPQNKHLIAAQIFAHFEFSFMYYCHYQIFNLFYYIQFDPCLGVTTTKDGLPILTETSQLILGGRTGYFFAQIVCTLGLFGLLHYIFIIAFIKNPLKMSQLLGQRIHLVVRFISYIFGCWFLCRIGLFLVFQPTYSFDRIGFISNTLGNGEYKSVFGFIPEITELILIVVDILIEVLFNITGTQIKKKIRLTSPKRKREEEQQIQFKQNPIGILENVKSNMRLTQKNNSRFLSRNPSFTQKQIDQKLQIK